MKAAWYLAYVAGIAFSVGGVSCSLLAYARMFRLHGKTELLPGVNRVRRRARGFFARFMPFLRQDAVATTVSGAAVAGGTLSTAVAGTVAIPVDGPVRLQVAAITRAIEHLEERLAAEKQVRRDAIAAVDAHVGELAARFAQSVDDLDAKLYDVGVDSLRLQILGVAMVMIGTVLLAGLSLIQPVAN